MHRSAFFGLLLLLTATASTSPALSSSESAGVSPSAVVQQATTVIVGRFTGASTVHVRELSGQFDESGRPVRVREAFTLYDFIVSDVISGDAVPDRITIEIVGGVSEDVHTKAAFVPPPPEDRVGIAIMPVLGAKDRYLIVQSRSFEARTSRQLESFRSLVEEARKPPPVTPNDEAQRDEELSAVDLPKTPPDLEDEPRGPSPDVPPGFAQPAPPPPMPPGLPGPIATPLGPPAPPPTSPQAAPPSASQRTRAAARVTPSESPRDAPPHVVAPRSAETPWPRWGVGAISGLVALLVGAGFAAARRERGRTPRRSTAR